METRSNKFLVGVVVAILLGALVAFSLWKSANERSRGRPFDIVGTQSASGLLVGSPVTYLGVPVGRVTSARLDQAQPGFVKIRIDVTEDDLKITQGTVARLSSDLVFGNALISLEPPASPGPVLLARAGEDAPRIPLESGGMGDLVSEPGPTVESIRLVTDRLLAATTPAEQKLLAARLRGMEDSSAQLAARAPELGKSIDPARQSLREGAATAANMARQADATRARLDQRGRNAAAELKTSLAAARDATTALNRRLESMRAPVQAFSESAAGTSQKIRTARESVAAIQKPVERVERGGVGALVSGPPTPDYKPEGSR